MSVNPELAKKKVKVDYEDLRENEEVVLVLKDAQLVDNLGNLIEEDQDVLENEEINQKAKQQAQVFKNGRGGSGAVTAEYRASVLEKQLEDSSKKLLPQYDEVSFEKKGIVLDETGNLQAASLTRLEQVREKLRKTKAHNLTVGGNVVASEYDDTDGASGRQNAVQNKKQFQKRQAAAKKKNEELLTKKLALDAEDEEALAKVAGEDASKKPKFEFKEEDDLEARLQDSLEKALRLKQKESSAAHEDKINAQSGMATKQTDDAPEKRVVDLLRENESVLEELEKAKKEDGKNDEEKFPAPPMKKRKGGQAITEIDANQDFLKNVESDEQQKTNVKRATLDYSQKNGILSVRGGTASVVNVSLPSERYIGVQKKAEEDSNKLSDLLFKKELDPETREKLKQEVSFLDDEHLGSGLTETLKRLRERGLLGDQEYDYIGRLTEKNPVAEGFGNKPEDRVRLDYRDENGRLMTQKQAFRYMCWIFHGKGPGKKKLEKMQRKELEREKMRARQMTGETMLMRALKMQQSAGNGYVLLNKSNSAPDEAK